ncbi:MAG TPA: cupin, partial [Polyangia bacterium]
ILFQLLFEVSDAKRAQFEKTYAELFEPALRRQTGFQNVKLIRLFSATQVAEISAAPTEYNYQINFVFESEALRRKWATSADHDVAWPALSALADKFLWRGYDILASTN